MRWRKLWRGLGWRGTLLLLAAPALAPLIANLVMSLKYEDYTFDYQLPTTVVAPGPAAWIVIAIVITWGRYRRSARTSTYQDILPRLVESNEEYCLILRPFGSDGEVVLPSRWFGASTVEQTIALAAKKTLGLTTYAIVDQNRRVAPPGPVYLRAPHDKWKSVVHTLIRRAHSILLILPPRQDIRDSFKWEIDQLTQHELQSRVTVVLPPDFLYPDHYPKAFHQACVLVATLEGFARSIDEVVSLRVHDLEVSITERTHVLKYCRSDPMKDPELRWWYIRKHKIPTGSVGWSSFYFRALSAAFETTKKELSCLGFAARYPWPLPPEDP